MKLGIFIGSFNPIHKGHIDIIYYLLNNHYIDKVLIIPTQNYWNKNNLIDIKYRIEMLKLFENDNIEVDTKHNNIPYTYDLLKELAKEYQEELYLILGADNLLEFDKWKNYQELLKYPIIIMNRNNIDMNQYKNKYPNNHFIVPNYQSKNISSTIIRDNLNSNDLDQKVLDYIKRNHLYKEGE